MICCSISAAMEKLTRAGMACPPPFQGCTSQEISLIESSLAVQLPQCYRDFLSQMGRSAGKFLVGYDYSFPKMLQFRKWAEDLLRECSSDYSLPPSAFVYFFDPAGAFLYFHCDGNPDPPVFMFLESESNPRKVFESFSEWLLGVVEDHITIQRERDQ